MQRKCTGDRLGVGLVTVVGGAALAAAFGMAVAATRVAVAAAPGESLSVVPWVEMDARSYAMGGAYVAVAQGVAASYWNPAGLASSPWLQVEAGARPEIRGADWQTLRAILAELQKDRPDPNQLPQDLDVQASVIGHAGVALRTAGAGVWGLVAANAQANRGSESWQASYGYTYWLESVAGGGMAVPTGLPGLGRLSVGAVGKRVGVGGLQHGEQAEPGPNPGEVTVTRSTVQLEATGNAVDVGAKLMLSPRWVVAAVVKNLGLELAGTVRVSGESSTQSVTPAVAQSVTQSVAGVAGVDGWGSAVGAAQGWPAQSGMVRPGMIEPVGQFSQKVDPSWRLGVATQPGLPGLVVAVDVDDQKGVHVGGEWAAPWRMVALRGGVVLQQESSPEYRVGLGVKLGFLTADAAAGLREGQLERAFLQAGMQF